VQGAIETNKQPMQLLRKDHQHRVTSMVPGRAVVVSRLCGIFYTKLEPLYSICTYQSTETCCDKLCDAKPAVIAEKSKIAQNKHTSILEGTNHSKTCTLAMTVRMLQHSGVAQCAVYKKKNKQQKTSKGESKDGLQNKSQKCIACADLRSFSLGQACGLELLLQAWHTRCACVRRHHAASSLLPQA